MKNLPNTGTLNDIFSTNNQYYKHNGENWETCSKFEAVNLKRKNNEGIFYKFLDLYNFSDGEFTISVDSVKEYLINSFRNARQPILQILDIEYMKADEINDSALKQQIANKKQALRDITNTVLPETLPELHEFWPEILNG